MNKFVLKIKKKTQWHILFSVNDIRIFGYFTTGIKTIKSNEYFLLPRLTKYDKAQFQVNQRFVFL